jgi:hypothetical protein
MVKKLLYVLLIALVVIQFFRPQKNLAAGQQVNAIATKYPVPDSVKNILAKACNDCHTNNTQYPWYSNIQPLAWWLKHHVDEGKQELNFDEFTTYKPRKADHKMEEVMEQVEHDEMPLSSYTWVHKDAKLSNAEKTLLMQWAKSVRDAIHYVPDSTEKKK